jgi:hypothetical protein
VSSYPGPRPAGVPPPDALRRFLNERAPCTIRDASELVGFAGDWVLERIAEEQVVLDTALRIPWSVVALWFLRAWSPRLLDSMLEGVEGWPELLRLTTAEWKLPRYLLMAIEIQVAREREEAHDAHDFTAEQWLSEQLHLLIGPDLYEELTADPALRSAYLFPDADDESLPP